MQKGLLMFFLKALMLFSFVSTSIFYNVNEINEILNPELVKPLWKVLILGIIFGFIFSVAHVIPSREK